MYGLNNKRFHMTTLEKLLSSIFGLDIFIERVALAAGPLAFSRKTRSPRLTASGATLGGDREWWFLGHHVVASPLQMSRR